MNRLVARRDFLRRIAATGIVIGFPSVLPAAVLGRDGGTAPSNRIAFGAIGIGQRARDLLPNFLAWPDVHFLAVSDCRADRLHAAKEMMDGYYGNQDCQTHPDFRELLARPDIDAVVAATGNRWNGLASIYAARAGKDVYGEKPISLCLAEGRALVETCRRCGTIYQAGTQRRSTGSYAFAREMVRQGKIGRLQTVEMQVWTGPAIPHGKAEPVPKGWNYDLWLGQAPWKPFVPGWVNNWQYFWDTADGMLADMGCHYTDQMQWVLGTDDTGPVAFEASGVFPDPAQFCSDTPLTATGTCRYANGVRGVIYQRREFNDRYIKYIGDEGWIQVDDATDEVKAEPKSILGFKPTGGVGWANASAHIRNFLDSIRSRRPTTCHPEVAHRAMTIVQAMNLSLRLGRRLKWDPVQERFDDPDANRMIRRDPRAPWRF